MKLDIFTLFPEAFDWFQSQRSVQNALAQGNRAAVVQLPRHDAARGGQVDDAPYGGGAGMVLRVDVVDAALQAAYASGERPRIVLLSPTGRLLDDELADELTAEPHLALFAGAMRGSTSGFTSTLPTRRSRSGATCWPAGSWRRW